jgi:hypothetical protein
VAILKVMCTARRGSDDREKSDLSVDVEWTFSNLSQGTCSVYLAVDHCPGQNYVIPRLQLTRQGIPLIDEESSESVSAREGILTNVRRSLVEGSGMGELFRDLSN